ncbi:MAG: hypothetical protein KGH71_06300, partial [Candidatus Micrarchaeota archaeon]|nr:hypothetical protein [Candidatus Micrarchaeota archaeon]
MVDAKKSARRLYNEAKITLVAEVFLIGFWSAEIIRDAGSLRNALRDSGDPTHSLAAMAIDGSALGV